MGVAERRQREREELRSAIIDAAVEIVSAQGVDALSIRAVAERVEYAPATIYLYFENKDALLRSLIIEAGRHFDAALAAAAAEVVREGGSAREVLRALRRGYIRFALEHTAAFRLLFALPGVPFMEENCRPSELKGSGEALPQECAWGRLRDAVAGAMQEGSVYFPSIEAGALALWASVHGYVSLYLAGQLDEVVDSADSLIELVESAA